MQRIAVGGVVGMLFIAGCASKPRPTYSRLPEPLLSTGKRVPLPAPPAPIIAARPKSAPQEPAFRLDTHELIPPGGIERGRWEAIVVHHSAAPDASPESMHKYHLSRGWSRGLGYHFVIGNGVGYPDGKIYVGPRWKKQQTGAHCKSASGRYFGTWRASNFFNSRGIGICLIGNFEDSPPTAKQLAALQQLIQFLSAQAGIDRSKVYGHGEITHRTACPGKQLNMARVRNAAGRIYAGTYR